MSHYQSPPESVGECKVLHTLPNRQVTQAPYMHNAKCAVAVNNLVHIDTCGPFPMLTPKKEAFFTIFLDDVSNYGVTTLLATKNNAIPAWKIVESSWELASGTVRGLPTPSPHSYVPPHRRHAPSHPKSSDMPADGRLRSSDLPWPLLRPYSDLFELVWACMSSPSAAHGRPQSDFSLFIYWTTLLFIMAPPIIYLRYLRTSTYMLRL